MVTYNSILHIQKPFFCHLYLTQFASRIEILCLIICFAQSLSQDHWKLMRYYYNLSKDWRSLSFLI